MMKSFLFSPIENKSKLQEAIVYTHRKCHELCKEIFGSYLPCAGNIGIFCHYEDEYEFLTKLREQITEKSDNWNQKYYRLHEPIVVQALGDTPGATYTHLYIRKPDEHSEVGDVDFVLAEPEYDKLKAKLLSGTAIKGMGVLNRPDLDLIKLSNPSVDALAFIGKKNMDENIATKKLVK